MQLYYLYTGWQINENLMNTLPPTVSIGFVNTHILSINLLLKIK